MCNESASGTWLRLSGIYLSKSVGNRIKKIAIKFIREYEMPIYYEAEIIGKRIVDFFVDEKIMVELKAVIDLGDVHLAQGLNYLEASGYEVGLLINFGTKSLQFKRLHNRKIIQ